MSNINKPWLGTAPEGSQSLAPHRSTPDPGRGRQQPSGSQIHPRHPIASLRGRQGVPSGPSGAEVVPIIDRPRSYFRAAAADPSSGIRPKDKRQPGLLPRPRSPPRQGLPTLPGLQAHPGGSSVGGRSAGKRPATDAFLAHNPGISFANIQKRSEGQGLGSNLLPSPGQDPGIPDTPKQLSLFEELLPTTDRLEQLRNRWTEESLLRRRLLFCGPFTITFTVPEVLRSNKASEKLRRHVTKNHHELFDYLDHNSERLNNFSFQVMRAWPRSFGSMVTEKGCEPSFLWQTGKPHLDDGTLYVCRQSEPHGSQPLLEMLFSGFYVHIRPSDNMSWQIMPRISTSILTMPTIAFLESLFAPTHVGYMSFGTLSDWFPIQNTTPVIHSTGDFGNGDWLCIRINLRTCIPDDGGVRSGYFKNGLGISPEGMGFPLRRQAARIPGFSPSGDQFAMEYLLSVALVMRKRSSIGEPSTVKHTVVAWVDYQTDFDWRGRQERSSCFPVLTDRVDLDLDLDECGSGGDGFVQFLIVLTRTIDHWRKCWDAMMGSIDELISVQLQDTLDKKRWDMLMFDESFQLSQQYFTVLQFLRIFQDWIQEVEQGISDLRTELLSQSESWVSWRRTQSEQDETQWPLDTSKLAATFDKVQNFFQGRVTPLKERIQRKRVEVESLRDGLFNAASLREAFKAKTLNLFIGVFTLVTVVFTPLGFVASFWALPFITPSSTEEAGGAFRTSFIVVPLLTYLFSGAVIYYLWGETSRSFTDFVGKKVFSPWW